MPVNKNALIRYKTIDRCLRNRYRRWTLDDLVEACSDALYELEGIDNGVSVRTVQGDLQVMRSDRLGYNAPIEVYDNKYYRYSDPGYSISDNPLSSEDFELVDTAVRMINDLSAARDGTTASCNRAGLSAPGGIAKEPGLMDRARELADVLLKVRNKLIVLL